jgi:hypothetical protein
VSSRTFTRTEATFAAGLLLASAGLAFGHEGNPSRYNYRDHVRPIFVEHCGGCHHSGGVAPMSLLDYRETVPWANAIKLQVLDETMPPWLPAEGVNQFRHARTLTAEEIDVLIDWLVGQTPEGEPLTGEDAVATPPPGPAPELVVAASEEVVLGADESEKRVCVPFDTSLDEPRIVTGFTLLPANASVLRRATIHLGASCEDGAPLATWLPDQRSVGFPEGAGAALEAGARLAVELHYVKGWNDEGERLTDRPKLGLSFSREATPVAPTRVDASSFRLAAAATLLALYPSPSSAAGEEPLRVEALFPDGSARPLLVIERFDPEWREKYVLERPLSLPAGTEIRVTQPAVWLDLLPESPRPAE